MLRLLFLAPIDAILQLRLVNFDILDGEKWFSVNIEGDAAVIPARNVPVVASPMKKLSNAISSRISALTRRADDNNRWSVGSNTFSMSIDLQMWSLALWKLPELYSNTYSAYDRSSSAVATAKFLLPCMYRLISNARCETRHEIDIRFAIDGKCLSLTVYAWTLRTMASTFSKKNP